MAIDSTLFRAVVPAATFAAGTRIPLAVERGPSVVRDGYGPAILKQFFCVMNGGLTAHVEIKNSNWVDSTANILPGFSNVVLSKNSSGIQPGHDCELQVNSGWEATLVIDETITTTTACDVIALIDIDYPNVQAVANPKNAQGFPVTNIRQDTIAVVAVGAPMIWTTINVDILKAGSRYLLSGVNFRAAGANIGFISISSAAGQKGLERIIPVMPSSANNLRYELDYSTPLVKGPFNLNYCGIGTAASVQSLLELDWVKK